MKVPSMRTITITAPKEAVNTFLELYGKNKEVKPITSEQVTPGVVRELRAHLRLGQKDFGELTGVSGNAVCLWESGSNQIGKTAKILIARIWNEE